MVTKQLDWTCAPVIEIKIMLVYASIVSLYVCQYAAAIASQLNLAWYCALAFSPIFRKRDSSINRVLMF